MPHTTDLCVPQVHKTELAPILEKVAANTDEMAFRSVIHKGKRYEYDYAQYGIGDSGASCHFCDSLIGMFNVRKVDIKVDGEFASS